MKEETIKDYFPKIVDFVAYCAQEKKLSTFKINPDKIQILKDKSIKLMDFKYIKYDENISVEDR